MSYDRISARAQSIVVNYSAGAAQHNGGRRPANQHPEGTMRSRYEPSGDEPGEESDVTTTPVKAPAPAAPQPARASSLLRDSVVGVGLHEANANEALYSAFQQLHLLAQGANCRRIGDTPLRGTAIRGVCIASRRAE